MHIATIKKRFRKIGGNCMDLTKKLQWSLGIIEVIVVVVIISIFYKIASTHTASKILLVIIPLFFSVMLMFNKEKTEKPIIFGGFTLLSMLLAALGNLLI
jgi:phage shock protein PspC (stress-responsive transcriptional regulator)